MRPILAPLQKDFYKADHRRQYPADTTLIYSNMTFRGSRRERKPSGVVLFGPQYFVYEFLCNQWDETFFDVPRDNVLRAYKRRMDYALGPDAIDVKHIGELHELGYLPLHVKSLPEGTVVPYRVPALTIRNTDPKFFWLTNMVESRLSNMLWKASTSATTAFEMRRTFEKWAKVTGADPAFIPWQGHDFSFRGMSGLEDACVSGAAHLLSFTGTDTIPAIDFLETYYGANCETELIGGSVPATEHSVMCMGLQDGEFETFERLITEVYPKGIVSIVSDTWDLWKVVTDYLPRLKEVILARDGKVVIRPDSGDPVKVLTGDFDAPEYSPERKGLIQCLWEIFGGTRTNVGKRVLDSHIGAIYGDSITPERQEAILQNLFINNFASSNVVLGVGSYTYEYVTRDTDGSAIKATYGETKSKGGQAIFKAPKTDDGLKNSAKGLLQVRDGKLFEYVSWEEEAVGDLKTIFFDGMTAEVPETLSGIRARLLKQL